MKKLFLLITIIVSFTLSLKAQDKIYRNNGKIVEAKIIEVGASEVKYREYNNPNGPVYVLETDRIKKIVYENGKVETFSEIIKTRKDMQAKEIKQLK